MVARTHARHGPERYIRAPSGRQTLLEGSSDGNMLAGALFARYVAWKPLRVPELSLVSTMNIDPVGDVIVDDKLPVSDASSVPLASSPA